MIQCILSLSCFYYYWRVNFHVEGYNCPKGTSFQILTSVLTNNKDYWTEPENFDPDRFYRIEESDKYLLEKEKIKKYFSNISIFGGGIKNCPGRKFAIVELKCLLALFYRKYDIELVDVNASLKFNIGFTNEYKELIVKIKPRKF